MTQQQKEARLKDAMFNLAQNPHFAVFMEELREMREDSVRYMIDYNTKEKREWHAAIGEVRAYDRIWIAYQSHTQPPELQAESNQ
jgi:hypothetical protein